MDFLVRDVRMAIHALSRNVMISALSTLGVVIAVAAVIVVVEFGQGANKQVEATISSMGANNIAVYPGNTMSFGASSGSGNAVTLSPQDVEALRDPVQCPSIARESRGDGEDAVVGVAPIVRVRTQVIYNNKNWAPMYLYGTTPAFLYIRDWDWNHRVQSPELAKGSFFEDRDVETRAQVCVLGQTVVKELFGEENPIDREIRINNQPFKVKGVLSSKGANMMGMDQDDIVLTPWTTMKFKVAGQSATVVNQSAAGAANVTTAVPTLNVPVPTTPPALYTVPTPNQQANTLQVARFINIDQILIKARSPNDIQPAIKQVSTVLRVQHKLAPGADNDFTLRDMTEMSKALGQTSKLMAILLLGVAMISLLVGGVGIMIVMLISVTERTREIGLRMAVGARPKDILRQFLVEAATLTFLGGILGILIGRTISYFVVSRMIKWPTEVSIPAILLALGVSMGVGIVFGFYPAWKASRLDPIEALRYE
jgi:ABC-type antimicrobial peptide transport system permease subunit